MQKKKRISLQYLFQRCFVAFQRWIIHVQSLLIQIAEVQTENFKCKTMIITTEKEKKKTYVYRICKLSTHTHFLIKEPSSHVPLSLLCSSSSSCLQLLPSLLCWQNLVASSAALPWQQQPPPAPAVPRFLSYLRRSAPCCHPFPFLPLLPRLSLLLWWASFSPCPPARKPLPLEVSYVLCHKIKTPVCAVFVFMTLCFLSANILVWPSALMRNQQKTST